MRKHAGVMALAALGAVAFAGAANAADIGVVGVKLIILDKLAAASKAKAVFVTKDAAVDKGAGTDPADISGSMDIQYDSSAGQFLMPQGANWLTNKSTVAKYVNKPAPVGGSVKVSVIKPAKLFKVVGKDLGETPIDISTAPSGSVFVAATVVNGGSTFNHCTEFTACVHKIISGGGNFKLICKGSSVADPSCAALVPPPPFLSFVTAAAGGTCGHVKSGGSGGTTDKSLTCGGLNVGGGNSTVAEGPTPEGAETQMNLSGGPVYVVTARTSGETGSNNNCSDTACQFGPYLPISNAGTSTCVLNTFSAGATGTLDSTTGDFTGSFPLTSTVYLTANGTDPCPRCTGGTPGVTNSGNCQAGWTSGVGASPTEGNACTPTDAAGDTYDCDPPVAAVLPSFPVNLTPITTGTASDSDGGGIFCPGQGGGASAGAFGCNGDGSPSAICPGDTAGAPDYIDEVGDPNGPVTTGTPTTLASVFCIPSVGGGLGFLINAAANLPGPGATSLPGELSIL